ncbi:hypothetical protein D9758_009497 [Tetrapyrgos nigripes]|uniref:Protein kinase domain-containing protein n=1 Tax=Tetrapyrgos nigripes TaxID=182062 RepID=A0A8H5LG23_9AGAR|nr:hypothetical protein D9758_009497 [Tetrapyrgos nigripes]
MSQPNQARQSEPKPKKAQSISKDPSRPVDFTFCEIDEGKLLLLEELGSGAYGRVYKAIDAVQRDKNHMFAVKCLRRYEKSTRDDDFQLREFILHKKVSSNPNVVTFQDAFYEYDHVFVVLELCEGGDLFSAIVEHGMFQGKENLIKTCFTQILDGVHFCHKMSVYHRDLKPENILCSRDGKRFLLADFGLATDQTHSRSYGCGSAEYMSPECIGKEFGFGRDAYSTMHNDIWALGIILINLITARSPWKQASTKDYHFNHFLNNNPWLLESLPISSSVFALLMQILQIQPSERLDSIPEIRRTLLAIQTLYASPDKSEETLISISSPVVGPNTAEENGDKNGSIEHRVRSDDDTCGPLLSDGDSDMESVGPITPETYPVHPELEVPDITEDEDMGNVKPIAAEIAYPVRSIQPLRFDDISTVKLIAPDTDVDVSMDSLPYGLGAIEAAKAVQSTTQQATASPRLPINPNLKIHQPLAVRAEPRGDRDVRVEEGRVANIVKALEDICAAQASPSQPEKDPASPAVDGEQVQAKPGMHDSEAAAVEQRGQRGYDVRKLLPKLRFGGLLH